VTTARMELTPCYYSRMSTRSESRNLRELGYSLETAFLDRDGVINRKMPEGEYVSRWGQCEVLPGVPQAIAALNQRGLRVIVVTNQRGVSLGLYSRADVQSIHAQLQQQLAESGAWVDRFYFCPHDKNECDCRKPGPGLFEQAQADTPEIDPSTSLMFGDSLSDIEFGKRLGLKTVFIVGDPKLHKHGSLKAALIADATFLNLPEAINCIFGNV
jgi:D-glycero-D-manno-heptose 1,7-bisphosphate phosphatase